MNCTFDPPIFFRYIPLSTASEYILPQKPFYIENKIMHYGCCPGSSALFLEHIIQAKSIGAAFI